MRDYLLLESRKRRGTVMIFMNSVIKGKEILEIRMLSTMEGRERSSVVKGNNSHSHEINPNE
jgi:hypothetical protein